MHKSAVYSNSNKKMVTPVKTQSKNNVSRNYNSNPMSKSLIKNTYEPNTSRFNNNRAINSRQNQQSESVSPRKTNNQIFRSQNLNDLYESSPLPNMKKRNNNVSNFSLNLQNSGTHQRYQSDTQNMKLPHLQDSHSKVENNQVMNFINNSSHYSDTQSIVLGQAQKSKAGSLPGKPIKTNQDSYISLPNFVLNGTKCSYFGVLDGHGLNGHHVSGFCKQTLPKHISSLAIKYKSEGLNEQTIRKILKEAYLQTHNDLCKSHIDVNFSGTTCVTCLIHDNTVYTANAGDSRAILMGQGQNTKLEVKALSRDHKPDDPVEKQRIVSNGGRVEPFKNFKGEAFGPARVWHKRDNIPGLAMSRSIGDLVAVKVGVNADPEILVHKLTNANKYMVIASDGVWEFLSNQQVAQMAKPFLEKGQLMNACDKLVRESTALWKKCDEVVDDITAVVVALNTDSLTS